MSMLRDRDHSHHQGLLPGGCPHLTHPVNSPSASTLSSLCQVSTLPSVFCRGLPSCAIRKPKAIWPHSSPASFLNFPSCPGNFCKPSLLKTMPQFGFPADLALTALPLTCRKGRGLTALWGHLKYSKTGPRDKVKHNGERSVKPELDSVSEALVRKWRWLRAFLHPGLCGEVVDVNGLGQSWPSEPLVTSQIQVRDGGLSTPCSS